MEQFAVGNSFIYLVACFHVLQGVKFDNRWWVGYDSLLGRFTCVTYPPVGDYVLPTPLEYSKNCVVILSFLCQCLKSKICWIRLYIFIPKSNISTNICLLFRCFFLWNTTWGAGGEKLRESWLTVSNLILDLFDPTMPKRGWTTHAWNT